MKEKLEVLISCMNQDDLTLAERTGVRTDTLLINQCPGRDISEAQAWQETRQVVSGDEETGPHRSEYRVRMLTVAEKGLSRSRNLAIRHAEGSIVLLCDDDERLFPDYEETILRGYRELPDADIIAFRIDNHPSRLRQKTQRLNRWTAMRISSLQITFRPDRIRKSRQCFDVYLGAGTGNGGGEEVMFLRRCIAGGLKAYYVPESIGVLTDSGSTWFHGHTKKFFFQRGITNRYMLGLPVSILYAFYYTVVKYSEYRDETSPRDALLYTMKGIFSNDIVKQRRKKH